MKIVKIAEFRNGPEQAQSARRGIRNRQMCLTRYMRMLTDASRQLWTEAEKLDESESQRQLRQFIESHLGSFPYNKPQAEFQNTESGFRGGGRACRWLVTDQ